MAKFKSALVSSIGSKAVVAITGIGLFLFLCAHLTGNLLVYKSPDALNAYGQWLRDLGPLLWILRGGLLVFFLVHVMGALRLARKNMIARPVGYKKRGDVQLGISSQSMVLTGLIVLAYVVYHLLHFTLGVTDPEFLTLTDSLGRHDVYTMLVTGFQNRFVSAAYIVANFLLMIHLWHATRSFLQTVGFYPERNLLMRATGPALSVLIFAGFVSIPISVLAGWVTL